MKWIVLCLGDVLTQRFTLFCVDWQDDGFADPYNVTDAAEDDSVDDDDTATAYSSLYYKFMLRKNGVTVPIAEGGQFFILIPVSTRKGLFTENKRYFTRRL